MNDLPPFFTVEEAAEGGDFCGSADERRQATGELRLASRLVGLPPLLGEHATRRRPERRVLLQDPRFEVAQLGSRLETELLAEDRARLLVCAQCVSLSILAIESDHQQRPPALDQRLGNDQ